MITQSVFGSMPDGTAVEQFCLTNNNGVSVEILNLGGIIRRWLIPNDKNQDIDIVLGFDSVADYLIDDSYLGALVGRYANRIDRGKFTLDGIDFRTDTNQNDNCLHGGSQGFNNKIWQSSILSNDVNPAILLQLQSPDGDQGFPGKIWCKVIYTLTEQNRLKIEYFASCDQTTIYNPTNHSYFNLSGHNDGPASSHSIQVLASHFTPTDERAIPTGEIKEVDNSPFDLRPLTPIKQVLGAEHQQLKFANGLDHNFCLDAYQPDSKLASYAAKMVSENKNLVLKVYTNMPGLQIFTANHFDNKTGKNDACYQAHQGVCFETQLYPDSPNHSNFPSATLRPNQEFYGLTEYEVLF